MLKIQCYVCGDEAVLRDAKRTGWHTVVGDDVRNYCTREACQETYVTRRAEFPEGKEPTSFADLSAEQLSRALKSKGPER